MLILDRVELHLGTFHLAADFTVPAGARVAVLGASGAGKSSLLLAMGGVITPSAGQILWNGRELRRDDTAVLFQDQNLFAHLSLLDNVLLGLTAGRRASAAQQTQAMAALARVGLADLANRKPGQVSGGQMGRAALARVLLQARPILLLDEPFSALDTALRHDMLDLLANLANSTTATVLMVTHDIRDAHHFADHVIFVKDGQAGPVQTLHDFLNNSPAGYLP